MFWNHERREPVQSKGRHPRPEDVANLLCGPVVEELPSDTSQRRRIIAAAIHQKELFVQMVEKITGKKEIGFPNNFVITNLKLSCHIQLVII